MSVCGGAKPTKPGFAPTRSGHQTPVRIPKQTELGDRTLTRVGLGTNRLTDTRENHEFLRAAVDAGLDFIDTAHIYVGGESELAIGNALADRAADVIIASKAGYRPGTGNPDALRKQIEESLARLRVDRIELYYLHRVDPETPLEASLSVFAEYRDAGRIGHVGLSQVGVEEIERAREVVPVAAVQNEYNLDERGWDDVIDFCEAERILFVPYYPLHGGSGAAAELAERYGAAPQQLILAWLLKRSAAVAPIPGTLSLDHLRSNLAALELELSDDDYQRLGRG